MEKTLETIVGVVERFAGNGRKLGYPTANLNYDTKLSDGVYFGYANLGVLKDKPALIFVGTPTTVGDTVRRVEAFLLDIDDIDYYGENMTLDVRYFHRKNQTFNSVDELVIVMKNDEKTARDWFSNSNSES